MYLQLLTEQVQSLSDVVTILGTRQIRQITSFRRKTISSLCVKVENIRGLIVTICHSHHMVLGAISDIDSTKMYKSTLRFC